MKSVTVYIVPPSFCPEGLLDPLCDRLASAGFNPYILAVPPVRDGATLESQGSFVRTQIGLPDEKVYGIGISKGAAILHQIAQWQPQIFSGVMLYGCPMLGQRPWKPVWGTALRILLTSRYRRAILSGKGLCTPKRKDAEDWLYGGFSHDKAPDICRVPESAKILQEMMFGGLEPNIHQGVKYNVVAASEERFHRNSGTFNWVRNSVNATYSELKGTHFGVLENPSCLDFITRIVWASS